MPLDSSHPEDWDLVISPERPLFEVPVRQLWLYRHLVLMFVKRDFVAVYKQTILGPAWYVVQPLLTTAVFTIVFNRIASIPTDGIPPFVFYLAGVVAWQYFASSMTRISETFTSNAAIFGKVYFPRLVVPISVVITNVFAFLIQIVLVACVIGYLMTRGSEIRPTNLLLLIPLLVVQMAMLALGVGIVLSSLTTRYRDLAFLVGFGTQLWMFATPVVYPLSQVPQNWRWLCELNPMTAIVEILRKALLGAGTVSLTGVVISLSITIAVLVVGLMLFNRVERTSMDTI